MRQEGPTPATKPEFPKVIRLRDGTYRLVGATHGFDVVTQEQVDLLISTDILVRWSDGSLVKEMS